MHNFQLEDISGVSQCKANVVLTSFSLSNSERGQIGEHGEFPSIEVYGRSSPITT